MGTTTYYSHIDENWRAKLEVFMEEAIITLFYEVKQNVTNVNIKLNTMTRTLNIVINNKEAKDRDWGTFIPITKEVKLKITITM